MDDFPDSDELGEAGQARFKEICALAGLRADKSDRDRTGWDFIVAFKFSEPGTAGTTLDARVFPLSAHVQVKTVLKKTTSIRVRLSSAEWLAKEPKPSFFYVFKIDDTKQFVSGHLLHVRGDLLGKILKRLRREEKLGNTQPNHVDISIDIRKYGIKLDPLGPALRKALRDAVGPDLSAYMDSKRKELKTIGYDADSFQLKASLHLNDVPELVDAMLGLKGEIKASNVSTTVSRFGIRLPKDAPSDGLLTIKPSPSDTCTIRVASPKFDEPAVFSGEIFFPAIPGLEMEHFKARIEADVFTITATRAEYTVTTKGGAQPRPLSDLINYWKLSAVLAGADGRVEITTEKQGLTVGFDVNKAAPGVDQRECLEMLDLVEKAAELSRAAGVNHEPSMTYWQLQRAKNFIKLGWLARHPQEEPVEITAQFSAGLDGNDSADIVLAGYVPVGTEFLGWYSVVTLKRTTRDDKEAFVGEILGIKKIQVCRNFPVDYKAFIETAKKDTGITVFHSLPLPGEDQPVIMLGGKTARRGRAGGYP